MNSAKSDSQAPNMLSGTADGTLKSRRLSWRKKLVFAFLATCLVFLTLELLLALVYQCTGASFLGPEEQAASNYPSRPDEFIKIAVFGGSAAKGDFAWRPFSNVLEYELQRRFPAQKIYVTNYALSGYPFHKHQAQFVKRLIDKYDIFLIYCGNNEAENWFDESGYWRHPQYKHARELVRQTPFDATPTLFEQARRTLHMNSRVYGLFEFCGMRLATTAALGPSRNRRLDYQEFEPADALPPAERENIVANFQQDLIEISELAARHDKQVLLAVTAAYETWPPCFSYFRKDITEEEKAQWRRHYNNGLGACKEQAYRTAIDEFQAARAIDSGVAILNHRLGKCYLECGDVKRGRRFLRDAIDQDGYYSRSISALHRTALELSGRYPHLHYVDVEAAFHTVLEGKVQDADLFVDLCHPSFLGHVVIGNVFVNQLLEMEPFKSMRSEPGLEIDAGADWKQLAQTYAEKLAVSDFEKAITAFRHIYWYFEMAHWTAYPELCYSAIDNLIGQFEAFSLKTAQARAYAMTQRARLAVAQKNPAEAVRLLNDAMQLAPDVVRSQMATETFTHYIASEFEEAGIEFSQGKYRQQ